jgi:hypothetical protein
MAQDPVAFREMVMAGVRLLEGNGKEVASGEWPLQDRGKRVASKESRQDATSLPRSLDADPRKTRISARDDNALGEVSGEVGAESRSLAGARDDSSLERAADEAAQKNRDENRQANGRVEGREGIDERTAAEYVGFEKAANAELERSVGGAIARTMEQALPNLGRMGVGKSGAELGERLKASVRDEVDAALKSDAQLSEQVAKILAGRRFDEGTRAQVVRLIDARAQQLVPGAVRRVVGNWTQTAMAARRGEVGTRVDVSEKKVEKQIPLPQRARDRDDSARKPVQRVNYGKLSDEEILEL